MSSTAYIGQIEKSDILGAALHDASKCGHNRKLKRILSKGINVDYPNSSGQSPLFNACYHNQQSAAVILLKQGANPNERSMDGATPIHAACYSCNMKVLSKLLGVGGDLRLHDNLGRTPRDWIMLQSEPKKKYKMLEFVEKTRYFAMSGNSKESIKGSSSTVERAADQTNSVIRFVRNKIRGGSSTAYAGEVKSVQSLGFGKVYLDNESWHGMISLVPLVGEGCLRHDNDGLTHNNGSFMVMESMMWTNTEVTVKRLHRKPQDGGHVDLLITESEFMGKVHHPNVLIFMGICQTNNLDGLVLLYERIGCGSLFHHLHDMFEEVSYERSITLLKQMCNALIFLHQQNLIHCNISSHAINLISPTLAKLGNFEYIVECCPNSLQKRSLVVSNTSVNAIYNWLAPELMEDKPPVFMSDMYGLCMVIYEIFEDKIPWEDCSAEFIKQKLVLEGYSISCQSPNIPKLFQAVLDLGLQFEPVDRKLSFDQLQHLLTTLTKQPDEMPRPDSDGASTPMTAVTPEHDASQSIASPPIHTSNAGDKPPETSPEKQVGQKTEELKTEETAWKKSSESAVILHGDQSNNSSSDLTQSDEPQNVITSSSCGQMECYRPSKARKVQIRRGREIIGSKGKLRRTSFPGINSRGSVTAYRDNEDTFHYSVCLSKKTSPPRPAPRHSVGSAATLSRCKKQTSPPRPVPRHSIGSAATLPRCKKQTPSRSPHEFLNTSGSGHLKDNSHGDEEDQRLVNSSVSSHSVSLPSMTTLKQPEAGSPSALYKAVTSSNQHSGSVEIVRDIRTELAMCRERKGVEPPTGPGPYRTAPLTSTFGCVRNDTSPKKFNYMNMGSPGSVSKLPIKPAILDAKKRRNQLLAESNVSSENGSPRKSQENVTGFVTKGPRCQTSIPESPKTPTDRRWYGGMGSVKNLVKKYQEQAEGDDKSMGVEEASWPCHSKAPDLRTPAKGETRVTACKSLVLSSDKDKSLNTVKADPKIPLESACESDKNSIDSGDSEEVLEWVNFHLDRIKTQMILGMDSDGAVVESDSCDLVFNEPEVSELSVLSTEQDLRIEVLPNSDCSSNDKLDITFSNTQENQSPALKVHSPKEGDLHAGHAEMKKESEEKSEPEEFYFDDVIQPSMVHSKHLKLQGTSSVPNYPAEVKAITQRARTASEDRHGERQTQKAKRIRRRAYSGSPQKTELNSHMGEQVLQSAQLNDSQVAKETNFGDDPSEGHTTVVSVRSSGKLPGKHTIIHTEIDRKTGIAETINRGTITAPKVISKLYAK